MLYKSSLKNNVIISFLFKKQEGILSYMYIHQNIFLRKVKNIIIIFMIILDKLERLSLGGNNNYDKETHIV